MPSRPPSRPSAGCVELVGAVDPHDSGLYLRGKVERDVDVLAPDARCEAVDGVVGQLGCFGRRAERHGDEDWTEDFFLDDCRPGMNVGEQSGREKAALLRQRIARLPAARALGHTCIDHFADGFKLHRRDNCADVDGFVERRSNAQRFHARANLGV